eukprot:COSAG01_NODE_5121_length_4471_cov_8.084629_2_plen_77_part_00
MSRINGISAKTAAIMEREGQKFLIFVIGEALVYHSSYSRSRRCSLPVTFGSECSIDPSLWHAILTRCADPKPVVSF